MKYFLLGAFSSGFFLYGSAMLYGFAGTVDLGGIADAVNANAGQNGLLVAGMALIAVGLFFKGCRCSLPPVGTRRVPKGRPRRSPALWPPA